MFLPSYRIRGQTLPPTKEEDTMRLDAFKTNGSSPPECGPDFQLTRQSTIYLLEPLTDAARVWAKEHIPAAATRFGQPSWSSTTTLQIS